MNEFEVQLNRSGEQKAKRKTDDKPGAVKDDCNSDIDGLGKGNS